MNIQLAVLFFFIYVAIVILIGIISSRKETEEDFMIAERKVGGVQLAATMSAGFFDGATLAIYLAYVYQFGLSALWLFVAAIPGYLILKKYAWRIKQKADEYKIYSMPEYFYKIFGKKNGLMFSFLLVVQFFLLLIVNLIISGKVLSSIFPLPYYISVAIGGLVVLTYLLLAGFKAVIRTDFFQLIIMFLMSISVGAFLLGKTHIPAADLNIAGMGLGNIAGFLILGGLSVVVAPDLWQRIFATKNEKSLKRGLSYPMLILPALGIIISIVGLATKQFFPHIMPENALIAGFSQLPPFGLKEFGLVLLYAVSLSSSDTITFVVSSIFTRDFKNYSSRHSESSMRKLTRFFMISFIIIAALVAIFYRNILALGFSLGSLSLALFPVVISSFYWKLKKQAVFWSLILAFVSVLILFITNSLSPSTAVISLPVALFALLIFQKIFKSESVIVNVRPLDKTLKNPI